MSQENVERVRAVYEAINRGDPAPLLEIMEPDIEWIEPDGAPGVGGLSPGSGIFRGREEVVRGVFDLLAGRLWDNFRVEPDELVDGGEYVVAMGHLRATVPGSDRPAETPFAHVWRLRDGRCFWWRCYEDTAVLHNARANWALGR